MKTAVYRRDMIYDYRAKSVKPKSKDKVIPR